jgi:hypothetical protein
VTNPRPCIGGKQIIVEFFGAVFRVFDRIFTVIKWGTLYEIGPYTKWKARCKDLGREVVLYRGVVIHRCKRVSV